MLADTMEKGIRNVVKAPVVLLVRLPMMSVLLTLVWIGEKAETFGMWLDDFLPGFDR